MSIALTLPVLTAPFLVALDRWDVRVFGPRADADGITGAQRVAPDWRIEGRGPWTHR
jgi:hypothetical protein